MDRRKSLKILATGAVAGASVLPGCKNGEEIKASPDPNFTIDRFPEELEYEKKLINMDKFFDEHEMATLGVLANIIIPADDKSGSATDAGVPEFIEFIVKDMPQHQVPMKGGLRWLDVHCLKRFGSAFKDCSKSDQLAVVEDIAYPAITIRDGETERTVGTIKEGMLPGVAFFSLMRNLTATGFYTSEIGVKDLGYSGNRANQWDGVPQDVLKKYNVAYTEKELKECISFNTNRES